MLAHCIHLVINAPIRPDTVHGVGPAQPEIDPPPLRVRRGGRNPVSGTFFDLRTSYRRRQAGNQFTIRRIAAEVAVNPSVPGQLAGIAGSPISGGGESVIVFSRKKREPDAKLPHL